MQDELIMDLPEERVTLLPAQSLALRRLIDAMKSDETILNACPKPIQDAFVDFYMPAYTTAEDHIRALAEAHEMACRRLENLGARYRELESKLSQSKTR